MVHKDQVGPREIAVLNIPGRLIAFTIEEHSRRLMSCEIARGSKTNLIEQASKDEDVASSFSKVRETSERALVFDNADCSTWGPSMMPHILYLTLGCRLPSETRTIIKDCFRQFSKKIFKMPDEFMSVYREEKHKLHEGDTNSVLRARTKILSASPALYNTHLRSVLSDEGMFQGILGVTSSVMAADGMRGSEFLSEMMFEDIKLTVVGHVTSDDSIRIISFLKGTRIDEETGESTDSIMSILNKTLSVHIKVMSAFGMTRNMYKSCMTKFLAEFNSVWRSSSGTYNADMKSRLSFVGLSSELDMYATALRCKNQGLEYLRKEGSMVGSCWVTILNMRLAMLQQQTISILREGKVQFDQVPLELGGYCLINPALNVEGSSLTSIYKNYTLSGDMSDSADVLMSFLPSEVEMVSMDLEDSTRSMIPSATRSGLINLCRREKRSSRMIRETLEKLDPSSYRILAYPGSGATLISGLMKCLKRESTTEDYEPDWQKFSRCQTPMAAPVFRLNCHMMKSLFNEPSLTVCRSQILLMARKWNDSLTAEVRPGEIDFSLDGRSFTCSTPVHIDITRDVKLIRSTLESLRMMEISEISASSRKVTVRVERTSLLSDVQIKLKLVEFDELHRPRVFGGQSDLHPLVYLESRMMLEARWRKLTQRSQKFNLTLFKHEVDYDTHALVLCSNFIESGKATLKFLGEKFPEPDFGAELSLKLKLRLSSDYLSKISLTGKPLTVFATIRKSKTYPPIDLTDLLIEHNLKSGGTFGSRTAADDVIRLLQRNLGSQRFRFSETGINWTTGRLFYQTRFGPIPQNSNMGPGMSRVRYEKQVEADGTLSSKFTFKDLRGHWHTYRTFWMGQEVGHTEEGKSDTVTSLSFLDDFISVTLKSLNGVICLCTTAGHPLFPLSLDTDRPLTEYYLVTNSDIELPVPPSVWSRMDSNNRVRQELLLSEYESLMEKRRMDLPEIGADPLDIVEDDDPFETHLDMGGDEDEMDDWLGENEMFDDDDPPESLDGDPGERFLSSVANSSVASYSFHVESLGARSFEKVSQLKCPGELLNEAKGHRLWRVKLPSNLPAGTYRSSEGESAFEMFLKDINAQDELESLFDNSFLCVAIRNSKIISMLDVE